MAFLVVLWRRPRRGMRLRLRGQGPLRQAKGREESKPREVQGAVVESERALNVVFNYNGETWDAYEVLGVPAGSSSEQVEKAYAEGLARIDETSKPFMEAAVRAIRQANRPKKTA